MSDFLATMAESSAVRAAQAPSFTDADFDKPLVPLALGAFDVIAEIKQRSPAEGQLGCQSPYFPGASLCGRRRGGDLGADRAEPVRRRTRAS